MAARRNDKRVRKSILKDLPQIGSASTQCKPAEDTLNALGHRGMLLLSVTTFGQNGRSAYASLIETSQKWQYKIIQFNMKDPLRAEQELNRHGEDGWVLQNVYSQGANNFATAAVLIRPAAELTDVVESGPEHECVPSDSEPLGITHSQREEGSGIHVASESLETVVV